MNQVSTRANAVGIALLVAVFLGSVPIEAIGQIPEFVTQELQTKLKVGYAVRALDVNTDGKLDLAVVDSKRVLWLENPTWEEHVIYETPDAKFDNVCFAPHDINGDGKTDFALGADWQFGNADSGGTIGWLKQTSSGPWEYHEIASEPTTHRMNWVDLDNTGKPWLVVAPLKGRGSRAPGFDQVGIRLLAYQPGAEDGSWNQRLITDQLHVMHNFEPTDLDEDGRSDLLAASYEGVTWISSEGSSFQLKRIGSGQEEPAPKRGASEIRQGKFEGGKCFIATVEPWHGDKIVVYVEPDSSWKEADELWSRFVLDEQLAWGHAVACANVDSDPDQELIVGIRDDKKGTEHRRGIRIYDPQDPSKGDWERKLVDPGGVAVEDMCVADLDGDGDNDIIAVGRKTHNVKIYWNQLK